MFNVYSNSILKQKTFEKFCMEKSINIIVTDISYYSIPDNKKNEFFDIMIDIQNGKKFKCDYFKTKYKNTILNNNDLDVICTIKNHYNSNFDSNNHLYLYR